MRILVIDGQGGGIGKSLVSAIKAKAKDAQTDIQIVACGTNAYASEAMKKAGADKSATGENAVIVNARDADVIVGPVGIAIANSLMGEVSSRTAEAVSESNAIKILVPLNKCRIVVVGCGDKTLAQNIDEAASRAIALALVEKENKAK